MEKSLVTADGDRLALLPEGRDTHLSVHQYVKVNGAEGKPLSEGLVSLSLGDLVTLEKWLKARIAQLGGECLR